MLPNHPYRPVPADSLVFADNGTTLFQCRGNDDSIRGISEEPSPEPGAAHCDFGGHRNRLAHATSSGNAGLETPCSL